MSGNRINRSNNGSEAREPDRAGSIDRRDIFRAGIIILGITVNVFLSFGITRLGLPFYLDSLGTITVSALCGSFGGIAVAVATSAIGILYNPYSLYFNLIGILIALSSAWFIHERRYEKRSRIPLYLLFLTLLGGGLGTLFQWILFHGSQFADVVEIAGVLAGSRTGMRYFLCTLAINLGINLVDKGFTAGASALILYLIPDEWEKILWDRGWRQKPLSVAEIRRINRTAGKSRYSLRARMTLMLIVTSVALTVIMTIISANLHFERTREEYTRNAVHAAEFAASLIDPDSVNRIIREGKEAEGYRETERLLERIRENTSGVAYLYVLRIEEGGCRFLYDLETEDTPAWQPGDLVPFEKAFEPYLPALREGREIAPIESDDVSGWVLTAYAPVRDAHGTTVCYAGADVSMQYLSGYLKDYLLRILLIFSGFFLLILSYGIWISSFTLIYPTGSMAASVEGLIHAGDDQAALDANVKELKELDIRTGDEIEKLYEAICRMAGDTAEQMREIRHYAEATSQMQNGLIVTMADMVESRDRDTGAHVQKTAAYVRIILEGLKRKGYYEQKLTRKYMNEVVMSAPLHDVGKIRIPDAVLNKPGKLTEEEFAVMKTHTTAGKEIMEKAIDTVQGGSYLKEARNMAAYHHERWDGKGYPEGLKGEVIPLSARVMAVADVFDALASPRVYKPAFPFEKAISIIEEGAGTQFDPKCVEVFLEALPEVRQILKKYDTVGGQV